MEAYIRIFKALADPTRLRILHLLLIAETELCVCEFVDALEEPQYNISRHLRILTNSNLLKERDEGRWVYYSFAAFAQKGDDFIKALFAAISSIKDTSLAEDKKRLRQRLSLREEGKCVIGIQKSYLLTGRKREAESMGK